MNMQSKTIWFFPEKAFLFSQIIKVELCLETRILSLIIIGIIFTLNLISKQKINEQHAQAEITKNLSNQPAKMIETKPSPVNKEKRLIVERDDFDKYLDNSAKEMSIITNNKSLPLGNKDKVENCPRVVRNKYYHKTWSLKAALVI